MLVNKSQIQLANANKCKKKNKGVRIDSNGFAHIVTYSSLLEASEKVAQENTTKASMAEYSKHHDNDWKAFNKMQVDTHEVWKVEKKQCKEVGVELTMTPPNPLAKKWEWKELYPPFDEEITHNDDDK